MYGHSSQRGLSGHVSGHSSQRSCVLFPKTGMTFFPLSFSGAHSWKSVGWRVGLQSSPLPGFPKWVYSGRRLGWQVLGPLGALECSVLLERRSLEFRRADWTWGSGRQILLSLPGLEAPKASGSARPSGTGGPKAPSPAPACGTWSFKDRSSARSCGTWGHLKPQSL